MIRRDCRSGWPPYFAPHNARLAQLLGEPFVA